MITKSASFSIEIAGEPPVSTGIRDLFQNLVNPDGTGTHLTYPLSLYPLPEKGKL
jgi:hypothetical protein